MIDKKRRKSKGKRRRTTTCSTCGSLQKSYNLKSHQETCKPKPEASNPQMYESLQMVDKWDKVIGVTKVNYEGTQVRSAEKVYTYDGNTWNAEGFYVRSVRQWETLRPSKPTPKPGDVIQEGCEHGTSAYEHCPSCPS